MQKLPSLGELIKNLEELPSIGKKSAIRMAMFMVKDKFSALKLANAIESAVTAIQNCKYCGNLTED
jgi:recombination protein RecR